MSLKRALEVLPHDRDSDAVLREVLLFFLARTGEWVAAAKVRTILGDRAHRAQRVLDVLHEAFVLDFDAETDAFRLPEDRLLKIEIDSFARRADSTGRQLRTSVERFRHMYGNR